MFEKCVQYLNSIQQLLIADQGHVDLSIEYFFKKGLMNIVYGNQWESLIQLIPANRNTNYLSNGDKVRLFSRDKTRDFLFFERQREK